VIQLPQLIAVFETATALALLVFVIFRLLPVLRLDIFRQEMFELRDELFDYAASGKIGFNEPAYRLLRQSMNSFIRYGHRLTFFRVCVILIGQKISPVEGQVSWTEEWNKALECVEDESVRKDLLVFHARATGTVATRVVSGSPLLILALVISIMAILVQHSVKNLAELFRRAATSSLSAFVDTRILDDEAVRAAA
jgi:hypothetical protein